MRGGMFFFFFMRSSENDFFGSPGRLGHLKPLKIRPGGQIFRILRFGSPQAKSWKTRKMQIVSPPQKLGV